jgi:hypothetical protein
MTPCHGLRGARSPSPSPETADDLHDCAPDESEDDASTNLDGQDDIGVLPNWASHYGADEQLARFAAYSTRPDLLRALYALEATSGESTLFHPKWIEQAKDCTLSVDTITRAMFPQGRVILGVDPARASGPRASWFVAIVVLFISATKTSPEQRVILDLVHERGIGGVEAQGAIVQELAQDWQAEQCGIEAVGGFGYLASYCEKTLHLPVKPLVTTKEDREEIPALANEFGRARWRIPWADARTQRIMRPIVNEMSEFGGAGAAKDCLMACTFARRVMYETPATKRTGNVIIDALSIPVPRRDLW